MLPVVGSFEFDFDDINTLGFPQWELDPSNVSCVNFGGTDLDQLFGESAGEERHVSRLVGHVSRVIDVNEKQAQSECRWKRHCDRFGPISERVGVNEKRKGLAY